jgi:23S rRNA (guanosine2251-2'-O)-methyltransferase
MKIAVLDNLRSVYNVGSIFRTANAVGIEKIILCGTTPTPFDTKGVPRKDFAKVALGAETTLSWEYYENTIEALEKLQKEEVYIIAFEQDERSVDYKEITITDKKDIAFIVGPEVTGMSKEVLDRASIIAEIPMLGTKESLNVTIAFGIGVYHILKV